ncbi:unnamed protein product [Gemmata massiliana]|uniref:Uncharacterized protein n=1 Tax=Gemmata massiliana TaxID=1210884 RepID=A0A6P2CRU1_9BACT|nr:hypothetical protein [Gemmata massiliana]VTR91651.1 unnamed protein product [Gemmata massiliana]
MGTAGDDLLDPSLREALSERDRRVRGGGKEQRAITFEKLAGDALTLWYSWATLMWLDASGTKLTLLFTEYVVTLVGRNLRPLRNRIAAAMEDVVRETAESRDFAAEGESVVHAIRVERLKPESEHYLDGKRDDG